MKELYKEPFPAEDLLIVISINPDTGEMTWKARDQVLFEETSKSPKRACAAWNAKYAGRRAVNNESSNGYRYGYVYGHMMTAHRVAWAMYNLEWPKMDVDHIDGNRENNRLSNLRVVTRQQNLRNRGICKRNTSGIIGVSFNKNAGKWRAYIKNDDKQIHIGLFETKEEAAKARKDAERKLGFDPRHGKRAAFNG